MKDDRSLVFVGDLHGQFNKFMSLAKRFDAECVDFVQVGDFRPQSPLIGDDPRPDMAFSDRQTLGAAPMP